MRKLPDRMLLSDRLTCALDRLLISQYESRLPPGGRFLTMFSLYRPSAASKNQALFLRIGPDTVALGVQSLMLSPFCPWNDGRKLVAENRSRSPPIPVASPMSPPEPLPCSAE